MTSTSRALLNATNSNLFLLPVSGKPLSREATVTMSRNVSATQTIELGNDWSYQLQTVKIIIAVVDACSMLSMSVGQTNRK